MTSGAQASPADRHSYSRWIPRLVSFVEHFLPEGQNAPPRTVHVPGRVQQKFWLAIDPKLLKVSFGRGVVPQRNQIQVLPLGEEWARITPEQCVLRSKSPATWSANIGGEEEKTCSHGLPATLPRSSSGVVRLSTALLEGLYWAQAQQLKDYVSSATSTFHDAEITHRLRVGDIKLMVASHDTNMKNSFVLEVHSASTTTQCASRAQPLLAASGGDFCGSATAVARRDYGGNLSIYAAFQSSHITPPYLSTTCDCAARAFPCHKPRQSPMQAPH